MVHAFTTLRHPVERLLEAEYFLVRLADSYGLEFQTLLNAFLSASRSVTFLLQASMARVPGFDEWYRARQQEMSADQAMRFFLLLRNVSQKQGPVSYVGGSDSRGRMTYRFVDGQVGVPAEVKGRDIAQCGSDQLVKLARLLLAYFEAFPFHACPGRAFTEEGMAALGYTLDDAAVSLGYPQAYVAVAGIPAGEILRILSRDIEPLDVACLERMSQRIFKRDEEEFEWPIAAAIEPNLNDYIAEEIEKAVGAGTSPRNIFVSAVMRRIMDIERSDGLGQPTDTDLPGDDHLPTDPR